MGALDGIHYYEEDLLIVAVLKAYFKDGCASCKELDYSVLKMLIVVVKDLAKVTQRGLILQVL